MNHVNSLISSYERNVIIVTYDKIQGCKDSSLFLNRIENLFSFYENIFFMTVNI